MEEDEYIQNEYEGEMEHTRNTTIVKFWMTGRHILTNVYSYETSVADMKSDLSKTFGIPYINLQILKTHIFQHDCSVLKYIDKEFTGLIDLTVVNTSGETPFMLQDIVIPDIITVHIENEELYKDVTVEIEDRSVAKPFLGGYSHKDTGLEYHHAFTQTGPPPERVSPRSKNDRDSQTKWLRNRRTEIGIDVSTQMASDQTCIPTFTDKIMTAKKYETADEREKRLGILQKIITIQRYWRAYKMRQALKTLHEEYTMLKEDEARVKREEIETDAAERRKEIVDKIFPRSRDDFSMLYAMVDRWKKAHVNRIQQISTPSAKLAEFYLLLNKETEMLSAIENQRHKIKKDLKVVNEIKFFHVIADPVKWTGYKNLPISMDTIETQKGRVFKNLYESACNYKIPEEQRIEFLLNLKLLYKDHNCEIANEIIRLCDREMELLKHRIDQAKLDMLRKRIEQMLLKHIKTPECNEGVTRRLIKLKEQEMKMDSYFCQRCQTFKPHTEFPLHARNLKLKCCMVCSWDDKIAEPWIDLAPYRFMLHSIRRDELRRSSKSYVAFILQERDIHYIVERIWHCQSAISECNNLEVLRLVRWDTKKDWAPWNCILLTEDEAKTHLEIRDIKTVYDGEFFDTVLNKHLLGRLVFSNVFVLDEKFDMPDEEDESTQKKQILH